MKFRITGLEERFVIREWLEKHSNNVRVVESVYQQEGRKEVTDWKDGENHVNGNLGAVYKLCG